MIYKLKSTILSAIFIITALLVLSFFVLTPMISMIILGAVFVYVIRPVSGKILHYLKLKTVSIITAMILVILPLIAVLVIIINYFIESTSLLVSIAKNASTESMNSSMAQQYLRNMLQTYTGSILGSVKLGLEEILKNLLNYLLFYAGPIPTIAFQLFIFFAVTFYFAKDWDKLGEYIIFAIPDDKTPYFSSLFSEIKRF